MTNQYWLVKQEPDSYPWSTFVADRKATWDGVRNYQARNHLRAMKKGDTAFFYASGEDKAVIGLAEITKTAFPDLTAEAGEDWSAVELKPVRPLKTPVTLAQIKATPSLKNMVLVRNSRLSVQPVTAEEFATIVRLGGG